MPRIRPLRAEALVLRQRPLGDADRICVLFSPTRGRVEAVAKGVRRPLSKLAGHVEPLNRGQFGLAQGRSLHVITDAQTLDAWPSLHDDVDRMTEALSMAELVDRSTDLDVASGPLYMLLKGSLDELARTSSPSVVRRWFTLRFLDQQGYQPELDECVRCRAALGPEGNGYAAADGGAVCPNCHQAGVGQRLSSPVFGLLRYMRRSSCEATTRVRVAADEAAELERHLRLSLEQALDGRLRSSSFTEALERAESYGHSAASVAADREREEQERAAV
ncbi:MAG: DNA repair protein RecO [Chloroflexi bacterium]|nr:DNA repair protein RecO [Chloroflexota bacterium]